MGWPPDVAFWEALVVLLPLPQHRMPSAVLLGGGSGRRFGGAGLAFS